MADTQKDGARNPAQAGPSDPGKSLGKAFSKIDIDGHDLPPSPAPSSPRNGKRYALATELVYTEGTDQYNASSQPIYQVRPGKPAGRTVISREQGENT